MAGLHNALRRTQLSAAIKRALGETKSEGGIERYGETLTPIIDLWGQPEFAYLRGERLGAIAMFGAAVPAEFTIIAFGNAAGSGNLVIVDAAAVGQTAQVVQMEAVLDTVVAATIGAAAFAASGRDRRFLPPAGRSFVKQGSDPANTFGIFLERAIAVAGGFVDFKNLPVVLRPGDDLIFVGQTINTSLSVNLKWHERVAQRGELAPEG